MKTRRIRIDSRFSALCIYRAWRKHLGHKQAYWLCVARYGWPAYSSFAWDRLTPIGKRLAAVA